MSSTTRTTITIDPKLLIAVKVRAAHEATNVSAIITKALTVYLKRRVK